MVNIEKEIFPNVLHQDSRYLNMKIQLVDDLYISQQADDEGLYIIGSETSESFFKAPKIGCDIICLIKKGYTINKIKPLIKDDVDYLDFLQAIDSMGLIKSFGSFERKKQVPIRYGLKFKQKFFYPPYTKLIFNSMTKKYCYLAGTIIILIAIIESVFWGQPILPTVDAVFSFPNLLYSLIIIYTLDIFLGITHETGHLLAARHFGLNNVNINIGRRLVSLVYQTQLPGIWKLNSSQKHVIYLAGILMDVYVLVLFKFLSFIALYYDLNYLYLISNIGILLIFLGFLFELKIYMRTDFYYLLADFLKEPNLHQKSVVLAKKFLYTCFSMKKLSEITEKKKIIIYTIFMISTSIIDIFIFIQYIIPTFKKFINSLRYYNTNFDINFIANSIAMLFLLMEILFLVYLFINELRKKKNGGILND